MKRVRWFLVYAAIIAGVAAILATWQHLPFWPAVLIAFGAILANGLLITVEDDLPGGFNNPDGANTPRYIATLGYVVRTIGVVAVLAIIGLLLLSFFGSH